MSIKIIFFVCVKNQLDWIVLVVLDTAESDRPSDECSWYFIVRSPSITIDLLTRIIFGCQPRTTCRPNDPYSEQNINSIKSACAAIYTGVSTHKHIRKWGWHACGIAMNKQTVRVCIGVGVLVRVCYIEIYISLKLIILTL